MIFGHQAATCDTSAQLCHGHFVSGISNAALFSCGALQSRSSLHIVQHGARAVCVTLQACNVLPSPARNHRTMHRFPGPIQLHLQCTGDGDEQIT